MEFSLISTLIPNQESAVNIAALNSVLSIDSPTQVCLSSPEHEEHRNYEAIEATESALQLIGLVWPIAKVFTHQLCSHIDARIADNSRWKSESSPDRMNLIRISASISDCAQSSETILHEVSHLAFYRVEKVFRVFIDRPVGVYKHPWRLGERPVRGALLAAHAFTNVAIFYKKLEEAKLAKSDRYGEVAASVSGQVKSVLNQLENGHDLAMLGRLIVDELRYRLGE